MGGGNEFPDKDKRPDDDKPPKDTTPEINVLITSFGPFPTGDGGQYTVNASHEIARRLPPTLTAKSKLNSSSVTINIVNPTAGEEDYIPVEYAEIRKRIRALHANESNKMDVFLHLGQADGNHYLAVEHGAFKEGFSSTFGGSLDEEKYYLGADNIGKNVNDLGPSPWEGVPVGLSTALPIDVIVKAANGALKDDYNDAIGKQPGHGHGHKHHEDSDDSDDSSDSDSDSDSDESDAQVQKKKKKDKKKKKKKGKKGKKPPKEPAPKIPKPMNVATHIEAGSYGCGFLYYESLANCFVQFRKRNVLFCHTPAELDEESLTKGRDAVLAVIGALAGVLVKERAAEQQKAAALLKKLSLN